MRCVECGHINITAFEFCEECLAMVPSRKARRQSQDPFDFEEEHVLESLRKNAPIPAEETEASPFPWNPDGHDVGQFIGRESELKTSLTLVQSVLDSWSARLALLLGNGGTGTSSFVRRFRDKAGQNHPDLVWAQAYCRNEPTRPYAVLGRLLRNHLQIPPQMDDWMAGERLLHDCIELLDDEDEARRMAILVAFLVGFKIEGSPLLSPSEEDALTLIPRASQALVHLLSRYAFDSPLVLVLDEAHRASAPLLALIDLLVSGLSAAPVLVLLVGRSELRDAHPQWHSRMAIHLRPMGRHDAERMLRTLLEGIEIIPRDLIERVVHQSGGNPHAIRAIVHYLHETGAITPVDGGNRWVVDDAVFFDLAIPDTLRGVAGARLSALTTRERQLLQEASIIGNRFWFGALVMLQRLSTDFHLSGAEGVGKDTEILALKERLESLVERNILSRTGDRTLVGEDGYSFRSELDCELLYEQCPAPTRQRIHRVVAHWLEVQPPRFVETQLARIARHLELSTDNVRSAQFYLRAARRAQSAFHNMEAIRLLEDAYRLTPTDDIPSKLNILFLQGKLHITVGRYDRALTTYREMLRCAWVLRSRAKGAVALNKLGQVLRAMGEYESAREHLQKAMQLFRAVHDSRGIAATLDDLGQVAWLTGDSSRALLTYERAKKLRTQLKDPRGLALTLHYIGCVHLETPDHDAAEKYLTDALTLRRKLEDRSGIARTLNGLGVMYWNRGLAERAHDTWRESLAICQEIGDRPMASMLMSNLGEHYLHRGETSLALPFLEEAETIAEEAGDRRTLATVLINLAHLSMTRSEHTSGLLAATRALDEATAIGNHRLRGLAQVMLGDISAGTSYLVQEPEGIEEGLSSMRAGMDTLKDALCEIDRATALGQYADVLQKLGRDAAAKIARTEASDILAKTPSTRPPQRESVPWQPAQSAAPDDDSASETKVEPATTALETASETATDAPPEPESTVPTSKGDDSQAASPKKKRPRGKQSAAKKASKKRTGAAAKKKASASRKASPKKSKSSGGSKKKATKKTTTRAASRKRKGKAKKPKR